MSDPILTNSAENPMTDVMPEPNTPTDQSEDAIKLASSILPTPVRNGIYIGYGLIGLVSGTVGAVLTATQNLAPEWFVGLVAAYAYLGTFVSVLATANTPSKVTDK